MRKSLFLCFTLFQLSLFTNLSAQTNHYVKQGGTGDGTSWANASGDLQLMINASAPDDQVWVAAGTYKPKYKADNMSDADAGDRNNAFVLKKDVKIYGGFTGNETQLNQRDSTRETNNTILSGDLGVSNDILDNAYHVVLSVGDAGTAELNGFTIQDGNANGAGSIVLSTKTILQKNGGGMHTSSSSPVLTNTTVSGNSSGGDGGGMFIQSSSPVITNIVVTGNSAVNNGGGINNYDSSPLLMNITISGNSSGNNGGGIAIVSYSRPLLTNITISGNSSRYGGGIYNATSSAPILTNIIISGNKVTINGGGMYSFSSSPVLTNGTITGNKATTGGAFFNSSSNPKVRNTIIYANSSGISGTGTTITYSLVQGLPADINVGNIDGSLDPKFLDALDFNSSPTTAGNFRITDNSSPIINKGNNTYFDAGQTPDLSAIKSDLEGKNRFKDDIDLGAYEFGAAPLPVTIVNFTAQVEGTNSLLKWSTASESNNREFTISRSTDGTNFSEIGKVAAAGSSNRLKEYVYYDANPANGINYYSLAQTDFEGRISQLGVRKVTFSFVNAQVINLYPNPVSNIVQVDFAANQYQQLELTDINGKVLQRMTLSILDTQKKVDMNNVSAGIYFIKLVGKTSVESRKVMKE